MNGNPIPEYGPALTREILAGFSRPLAPIRLSPLYRVGLAFVALGMVLLPLLYLALVVATVAGGWFWIARVTPFLRSLPGVFKLLVGGAPLFALLVIAVFLIKAIWPRRRPEELSVALTPAAEPLLFAFVERLAKRVGAPVPREIRVDLAVNASAGPRHGALSLLRRDLVLTVGLPLAAGLPLQQMAGVLAHELGHFAQRHSMLFTYLIRRISAWLYRLAEERDPLDDQIEQTIAKNEHWSTSASAELAAFGLKVSRGCLRLLMRLGHVIGSFQMRQMELDADRYEARLAGRKAFDATMRDLPRLHAASERALADLGHLWRTGRLAALPDLVVSHRQRLPPEVEAEIESRMAASRTSAFDTHPADSERLASVRAEPEEGAFRSDLPATALFRDFAALSREVSLRFYRPLLGEEVRAESLVSAESAIALGEEARELESAFARFVGDAAWVWVSLPWTAVLPRPESPAAARQELERLRGEIEPHRQRTKLALESYLSNAFRADVQPLRPGTPDAEVLARRRVEERLAAQAATFAPFAKALAARLTTALGSLALPEIAGRLDDGERRREEAGRLYASLVELSAATGSLVELGRLRASLSRAWEQWQHQQESLILRSRIRALSEEAHARLRQLDEILAGIDAPDSVRGAASLARYAMPRLPGEDQLGDIFKTLSDALDKILSLRRRLLAALAVTAGRVEDLPG